MRRSKDSVTRKEKEEEDRVHTAFTPAVTSSIYNAISTAARRVAEHTMDWNMSWEQMVARLWAPHIVAACREGYIACSPSHRVGQTVYRFRENMNMDIMADWGMLPRRMLAPDQALMLPFHEALPELIHFRIRLHKVQVQFGMVFRVFHWFNENAKNPATVREYCPWIEKCLLPDELHLLQGRVVTVGAHMGRWLPMIREAPGIMATALLIQGDPPPRVPCGFELTLSSAEVMAHGQIIPTIALHLKI